MALQVASTGNDTAINHTLHSIIFMINKKDDEDDDDVF